MSKLDKRGPSACRNTENHGKMGVSKSHEITLRVVLITSVFLLEREKKKKQRAEKGEIKVSAKACTGVFARVSKNQLLLAHRLGRQPSLCAQRRSPAAATVASPERGGSEGGRRASCSLFGMRRAPGPRASDATRLPRVHSAE